MPENFFADLIPKEPATPDLADDLLPRAPENQGNSFADLIPENRFSDLIPQRTSGSAIGRIAEAAAEGFRTVNPEGIGFTQETEEFFGKAGIIATTPEQASGVGGLFRTFNQMVLEAPVEAFDIVAGVVEGAVFAAGQTLKEFGVSDTARKRFVRAANDTLVATLPAISTGGSVSGRLRAPLKTATKDLSKTVQADAEVAALQSARQKIGAPTLGDHARSAKMRFVDRQITEIIDGLRPIKLAAERGAKEKGITPDLSPYRDMRLIAGVRGTFEAIQKRGTIGRAENGDIIFTGKGLNETFRPIADKIDDAMLYFAGRRAKELKGQGREKLFSDAEIDAMVALGKENPEFTKVFADFQAMNKRVLDFAEQSGLLDKKQKAAFERMGQSYVPFYRIVVNEEGTAKIQGSIFKRLKGGEANVNEIMDNIYRNMAMWTDASVKNHAKTQVYNMIEKLGLDDIAVRVPLERIPQNVKIIDREIVKTIKDLSGVDISEETIRALTFNRPMGKNIDFIFRNGKREFFEIKDPLFLKSMLSLNPKSYPLAIRILGGFKMLLTRLVTASPDFMAVNGIRDTQAAFLQTQANFIPIVSSLRGMASRMTRDANYWQLMANGGGFATLYRGEVGAARNLKSFYTSKGINYSKVLDTPRKIADAIENVSSVFEMAARLEEFRLVKQESGLRTAALAARDVSTDFAKRGASDTVQAVMSTLPFVNARLQGFARLAEVGKATPLKLAIKGISTLTLPALALYALNKDDIRYQELPDWVKDLHYVILSPDDSEPLLIPKGFEYGAIFSTIPERMFEAIEQQHGKRFANSLLRIITQELGFNPIPQAFRPIIEQIANKNFFTDSPIVATDLKNIKLSEQFRPWTSETMIRIARELSEDTDIEFSPVRAEALVRGYLGTIGMYALDASDSLIRAASGDAEPPTARLDEMPVIRRFLREDPIRGTKFETDFYEFLGEARTVVATVSKMLKEARKPNLTESEKQLFRLAPVFNQVQETATAINQQMRLIQADEEKSGDEKRAELDELQRQKNNLFRSLISEMPQDLLRKFDVSQPALQ